MYVPRAMYSLRMSFWIVPVSWSAGDALLLGDELVEQQQHRGGRVDRHRRGDLVQRDAVEQDPHVVDRVDRHADLADLAVRDRRVGVVAHLGGQVEGDRQARRAVRDQLVVAGVGLGGGAEAGVLAHRPRPAGVHRRVDAAGERVRARLAQLLGRVPARPGRPARTPARSAVPTPTRAPCVCLPLATTSLVQPSRATDCSGGRAPGGGAAGWDLAHSCVHGPRGITDDARRSNRADCDRRQGTMSRTDADAADRHVALARPPCGLQQSESPAAAPPATAGAHGSAPTPEAPPTTDGKPGDRPPATPHASASASPPASRRRRAAGADHGRRDDSEQVRELQARLRQIAGTSTGPDRLLRHDDRAAVKAFQGKRGLPATGRSDTVTWSCSAHDARSPRPRRAVPADHQPADTPDPRCMTGPGAVHQQEQPHAGLDDRRPGRLGDGRALRLAVHADPGGLFHVDFKSRDHVSTIYHTPMPYAMFFSGGQAVHYSADFAARGYAGPRTAVSTSGTRRRSRRSSTRCRTATRSWSTGEPGGAAGGREGAGRAGGTCPARAECAEP